MVEIRQATRDDLPAIVALLADDALGKEREDTGTPLNEGYVTAFEAITRDPNQLLVVADDGSAVVGCLQITFIPGLSRRASGAARSKASALPAGAAAPASAARCSNGPLALVVCVAAASCSSPPTRAAPAPMPSMSASVLKRATKA